MPAQHGWSATSDHQPSTASAAATPAQAATPAATASTAATTAAAQAAPQAVSASTPTATATTDFPAAGPSAGKHSQRCTPAHRPAAAFLHLQQHTRSKQQDCWRLWGCCCRWWCWCDNCSPASCSAGSIRPASRRDNALQQQRCCCRSSRRPTAQLWAQQHWWI